MLIPALIILFILAPAFAVWEQRAAERRADRLADEVRAEIAAGRPPREAPPARKLALWPYAILALVLSVLWSLGNIKDMDDPSQVTGVSVFAAVIVWLAFHIFIFVKRTSTPISLLLLAAMIGTSVWLSAEAGRNPAIAALANQLP